jgi:hypothetical protein
VYVESDQSDQSAQNLNTYVPKYAAKYAAYTAAQYGAKPSTSRYNPAQQSRPQYRPQSRQEYRPQFSPQARSGGCGGTKPLPPQQSPDRSGCSIVKPSCGLNSERCPQAMWNQRQAANQTFHSANYGVTGISVVNKYNPSCIQEPEMCTLDNAWVPETFNYVEPAVTDTCTGEPSYASCLASNQLEYNPKSYAALY